MQVDTGLTFAEVVHALSRVGYRGSSSKYEPPWKDALAQLRSWSSVDAFGEAQDDTDLDRVPFDEYVRIVYFDAPTPTIRWATESSWTDRCLGGHLHAHIERGDGNGVYGKLYRNRDGRVSVYS